MQYIWKKLRLEKSRSPHYYYREVIPMRLQAAIQRMLRMCPEAWYIQIRSIQLCCALLLGALCFLIGWSGDRVHGYSYYQTAQTLNECAQTVLLIGVIVPPLLEDWKIRKK